MTLQHSLMFQESLRSPESVKMYTFLVKKFMKYHNIQDFDSIVKIQKDELQKMVKECPICNTEFPFRQNFCPSHYPAIKLTQKEVEL